MLTGPMLGTLQKGFDQNKVKYVSISTKKSRFKSIGRFSKRQHILFPQTICLMLLPDTYDNTLTFKINYLEMSRFKTTPRVHWFSKVLLYLKN